MRYATKQILPWLLAPIAALVGWEAWQHLRPASARAKAGDDVLVSPAAIVPVAGAAVPAGTNMVVRISSTSGDSVTGSLVGYFANGVAVPLPVTGVLPQTVPRGAILGILKDGQVTA